MHEGSLRECLLGPLGWYASFAKPSVRAASRNHDSAVQNCLHDPPQQVHGFLGFANLKKKDTKMKKGKSLSHACFQSQAPSCRDKPHAVTAICRSITVAVGSLVTITYYCSCEECSERIAPSLREPVNQWCRPCSSGADLGGGKLPYAQTWVQHLPADSVSPQCRRGPAALYKVFRKRHKGRRSCWRNAR